MGFDLLQAQSLADGYTSAWNTGSARAVAEFYAAEGSIVINRGTPWQGRAGVEAMAAGFYADAAGFEPDQRRDQAFG
ncbi:MAG: hypothetical protein ACOH2H_23800 [Cypionkella sp.]